MSEAKARQRALSDMTDGEFANVLLHHMYALTEPKARYSMVERILKIMNDSTLMAILPNEDEKNPMSKPIKVAIHDELIRRENSNRTEHNELTQQPEAAPHG